ncbi:hypothetical protein BC937DRAFT_94124 [Endogone sp. FLAS-F59071]|nr:hypothetical protein BC937DRAFT_94124 [Endogone sp. FLAS-F59071]|eukprot:RUS23004.1 hypothetical protein BC937DRAFT_94124 [Endogone sp. FLAS-F59071]
MTDASSPASTSIGVGESRHAHRSDSSVALEQVVHQIAARVKDLKDNLDKNSGQWMIHELDRITQETLVLQEAEIHRSEISDVLDELGISVWNLSSNLKTAAQMNDSFNGINENLEVIAHLRQTGFIMVKVAAGPMPLLEEKMLLKVLNMAAKLAKAWFDNDNLLKADAALNDATNVCTIEVTIKQLPRSRKSASDELRAISFINLHMYRAEVVSRKAKQLPRSKFRNQKHR